MHVAHPLLALISWQAIPQRLPSSKADCRGSLSIGSTTRSSSPTGIVSPLASFRLPQSMIIQLRRRNGGGGQLPDCRARIFIPLLVQPRLPALSSPCRTNSFYAPADSRLLLDGDSAGRLTERGHVADVAEAPSFTLCENVSSGVEDGGPAKQRELPWKSSEARLSR
jgi:hypothetical protein